MQSSHVTLESEPPLRQMGLRGKTHAFLLANARGSQKINKCLIKMAEFDLHLYDGNDLRIICTARLSSSVTGSHLIENIKEVTGETALENVLIDNKHRVSQLNFQILFQFLNVT